MPGRERRTRRRAPAGNRTAIVATATAGAALILIALVVSMTTGGGGSKDATASTLGGPVRSAAAAPTASRTAPAVRLGAAPTAAATDACVTGQRLAAGPSNQSVRAGGVGRSYLLAVPTTVKAGKPLGVIINFHGFNQSALTQENYTHLSVTGTKDGYIVVTPLGYHNRWNFVRRAAVGPDDVVFISTLLSDLGTRTCLDQHRIFATGISDGADMAVALGCALPTRIAAVVPVAASIAPASCGATPPSMLEIHGTADPVVPFNGGGGDRSAPFQGTAAQPVQTRLAGYAKRVGCTGAGQLEPSVVGTKLTVWARCPAGKDVLLLAVTGGGHTWPGAAPQPSQGATSTNFSANEVIVAFFDGHAKPGAAASAPAATPSLPAGFSAGGLIGTAAG